ncbi:MAG: hypothetical protein ACRD0G_19645 [Acidimicrobiales bacterium]
MTNAALQAQVTSRTPLKVVEAYSGAWLERVALADGRVVIVKHLPADGDWLTRVTDGLGRTQLLWRSGLLQRLEPAVEHGVLDLVPFGDHDAVVMADLTERLWPHPAPLDRGTIREAMAGLAAFHGFGERVVAEGCSDELALCPLGSRYGMFAPAFHAADRCPNPHPVRDRILAGWELFAEFVDGDVAAAVAAVHGDPDGFGRRLAACSSPTILHGDAKPQNLGVTAGRLTAIAWGELTGVGPREVDVAWFALMSTRARLDVDPNDVFAIYQQVSGSALDPAIVDLACIGSLAQMGFRLATVARLASRPEARHEASTRLAWWADRVRTALDRGDTPS